MKEKEYEILRTRIANKRGDPVKEIQKIKEELFGVKRISEMLRSDTLNKEAGMRKELHEKVEAIVQRCSEVNGLKKRIDLCEQR